MNPRGSRREYGYSGKSYHHDYLYSTQAAEDNARMAAEAARVLAEVKAKQCHPECGDGYCHRAYMRGPILQKEPAYV